MTAAVALGLDAEATARAMALAVPAAGGLQRSFGTQGKPLQVGFATDAGVRAARLAAAGATADPSVLEAWMALVGGDPARLDLSGPAVPGGLAVKVHPEDVDTVASLTDEQLLALRNLGPTGLARIWECIPQSTAGSDGADRTGTRLVT